MQYYEFHSENGENKVERLLPLEKMSYFFDCDARTQFRLLYRSIIYMCPGIFYRKSVYQKIGLYDEQFPAYQDWPFFARVTRGGIKYHLIHKPCFLYRVGGDSVSYGSSKVYNTWFKECSFRYHWYFYHTMLPWIDRPIFIFSNLWSQLEYWIIVRLLNNKRGRLSSSVQRFFFLTNISTYTSHFVQWLYNHKKV